MFSMAEIIDLAIQIEKNGERIYRKALEKMSDPSLASLLQHLADEEVEHAKWFSEMKATIKETTDDPSLAEKGNSILRGVLGGEAFSLGDADFSKIDGVQGLLKLAIEFEKDTVLFYEMLGSFIEDKKTLDQLNAIIEEENRHAEALQAFLHKGGMETDPSKLSFIEARTEKGKDACGPDDELGIKGNQSEFPES
jgi:rubrerythrin